MTVSAVCVRSMVRYFRIIDINNLLFPVTTFRDFSIGTKNKPTSSSSDRTATRPTASLLRPELVRAVPDSRR